MFQKTSFFSFHKSSFPHLAQFSIDGTSIIVDLVIIRHFDSLANFYLKYSTNFFRYYDNSLVLPGNVGCENVYVVVMSSLDGEYSFLYVYIGIIVLIKNES
jgi:hypothetical protein